MDTLDNMDWQGATGGAVQRQGAFELGGISFDNWYRMQSQNEKPISVIIGNPPYNDSATLWNDGGANRKYPEIDRRIRDTYIKESSAQKTHQYDMYKRFIRWASDRLADDGIIAFVTNRAYLDSMQDDGFRKISAGEFSDIYIIDLGSDVRRNPKISGTKHNVFRIQTGVAVGFFVREKSKLGRCDIHYVRREDAETAVDKLAYLGKTSLGDIEFEGITPDKRDNWLNQVNPDFEGFIPLANRETKFAKADAQENAVFRLFTPGVKTDRDEWVYDFDVHNLRNKALFFGDTYNELLDNNDNSYPKTIKWSHTLQASFQRGERLVYNDANRITTLFRPFVVKHYYAESAMSDRLTRNHYEEFGLDLKRPNKLINFCVNRKHFYTLATGGVTDFHFTGDTQTLPLYRYTDDGEWVSNITDWGLKRINAHYRREFGDRFSEAVGADAISAEDVFAYTYAVLHDPAYRREYAVDLLREFPRLPLHRDFGAWRDNGRELLDLHIEFESAEPYPLQRVDALASANDATPKVMLRANARDKSRGEIQIDSMTKLRGVPDEAWRYKLGSRSALEWVLDQYKEKKPRDPMIRERFNNYRFADHKEAVIALLRRVCAVSVRTMEVVDGMGDRQI